MNVNGCTQTSQVSVLLQTPFGLRLVPLRRSVGKVLVSLIAPGDPAIPRTAGEQFQIGTGRAGLDQSVGFVWLARMLAIGEKMTRPASGRV